MKVNSVQNNFATVNFQQTKNNNPISKSGEKAKLVKTAFIAGGLLGARLLFELADCDFVFEHFGKKAEKIVTNQNRNISGNKKLMVTLGVFAGLVGLFIAGFAMIYTLFQAPKINYQGNVNAFKKGKAMDVYIKGNNIEKNLYTQMNEKAKNADSDEKNKLREQYMKMQLAKNKVPDFINLERKKNK